MRLCKQALPGCGFVSLSQWCINQKKPYLEVIRPSREELITYMESLAAFDATEVALAG